MTLHKTLTISKPDTMSDRAAAELMLTLIKTDWVAVNGAGLLQESETPFKIYPDDDGPGTGFHVHWSRDTDGSLNFYVTAVDMDITHDPAAAND